MPFMRQRAAHTVTTLGIVVLVTTIELAPILTAAIVAVGFLHAVGRLDTNDAWSALNADVLVLIFTHGSGNSA